MEQAMKIPYTYTIEQLDVQFGQILVKYTPTDENLTSITLNILMEFGEDGTALPLELLIDKNAPYREWASQNFFISNSDSLLNATGRVN